MSDHVALGAAKDRLSEVVDRVEREHDRIVITKHGRPAAVLLSPEDLASLEETLAVLSDRALLRDLRTAAEEEDRGETVALTKEQALALVRVR